VLLEFYPYLSPLQILPEKMNERTLLLFITLADVATRYCACLFGLLYCYVFCVRTDKIKKSEMCWECGTYGGEERCMEGFGGDT
jgi:hypothetical protein